jgi:anti-sigma B factor antagonist
MEAGPVSATGGPALRASVTREDGCVVVALTGELDLATAGRLRTRLSDVVQSRPAPRQVVLDLAGLEFVDAAGISVLLGAQRALQARGGELCLRSPSRLVRRVVKVLDLERVLPVER